MEDRKLITNYKYEDFLDYIVSRGMPKFRAKQIFEWIYEKRVLHFELMTNIPQAMQKQLDEEFVYPGVKQVSKQVAKDKTIKWLLEFTDKEMVETVLMSSEYGNTVCISAQVGCKMACTFCASTLAGYERDLTAGEMVEQVMHAQRFLDHQKQRVSNIVVMGIGEPLDNYNELIKFIRIINSENGLNIGQRHITISTCGVVPRIYDLMRDEPQVSLSISLHAAEEKLRTEIMPINKKYSLQDLIQACIDYINETNRRITFEYALIKDVNDQAYHARKLSELLKGMLCHVNLIPLNEVVESKHSKTPAVQVEKFKNILLAAGISVTVRKERGSDIDAACGQLRISQKK